ncbi:protein ANTAGONIST OF LIKE HETEROCHROMATIN PROTEIN 1 [Gadus morhua]|nr:protein ANTAGONIST OF LIKE HETEROCHROMATIN PROTEIN 1-like [Gadus morhua]
MLLSSQHFRRKPSAWAHNRSSEWWDVIVPGFTNEQWVENFRMSEETFGFLTNKLRPVLERQDTNFRGCVPLKKRVAIALWKLATGSEYRSIGHLFGVSITTVCRCVQDFCAAAETLLVPEQIRYPDEVKFREMATYIENRWGLPHCVGAIDGSHIPILAPQDYHCDFFNRKGWHSILLQGVVDGKGLFWNVFAGLAGSMHDARVLRVSKLWELASRGNHFPARTRNIGGVTAGYYILGDSAYPLQNWLLKPFQDTGRLTAEQQMFNRKFSRVRVVVENAFGRLKGRWRCLLKRNDSDLQLVKSMVMTCCALHNLCENHGETYETELTELDVQPAEPGVAVAQDVEGINVREGLMQFLLANN